MQNFQFYLTRSIVSRLPIVVQPKSESVIHSDNLKCPKSKILLTLRKGLKGTRDKRHFYRLVEIWKILKKRQRLVTQNILRYRLTLSHCRLAFPQKSPLFLRDRLVNMKEKFMRHN